MAQPTEFQKEVKSFAIEKIREVEAFAKKAFDLSEDFHISTRIRFSMRGRSWGGIKPVRGKIQPFVSLDLGRCDYGTFHEYKSFADNKYIGAIHDCNWKKWVTALVTHEIGHVVQFSLVRPWNFAKDGKSYANSAIEPPSRTTGHDLFWKNIYRVLREEFVNGKEFDISIKPVAVKPVKAKPTAIKKITAKPASVKDTITAVANKIWVAAGRPTDVKVILNLRKEMMDVLEKHGVKRTTASVQLGVWQKEILA